MKRSSENTRLIVQICNHSAKYTKPFYCLELALQLSRFSINMLLIHSLLTLNTVLLACVASPVAASRAPHDVLPAQPYANETRESFINRLVSEMTVTEMALQLHLMFADNIVGPKSDNSLWDQALRPAPENTAVGVVHDWYPLNKSYYNGLQRLNLEKSRLKIPFLHVGECLHGVGSFKQSMFPQTVGLAASFDQELVHRVGRAIGEEARSIGVHACFSPVLDVCQDQRWGRCQGEYRLTSGELETNVL